MSQMRLSGLATGMDTDNMVKQMMKPYKIRVDKVKQDRQLLQWKQDLYRDMLTETNKFKNNYFEVLNSKDYMLTENSFVAYDIDTVNELSNKAASVKVTAGSGAIEGNYKIEVAELAMQAKIQGEKLGKDISNDSKLSSIGINKNDFFTLTYKIGSNPQESVQIKIEKDDMSVKDLSKLIADKTKGNVKLYYSELTENFTLKSEKYGEDVSIKLGTEDTINNIFGMGLKDKEEKGKDSMSIITAPGASTGISVKKSSNDFTIDGINYTLVDKGTNNISIKNNVDKPYEKIKDFVEKYNELIDNIGKKSEEKRQYKYLPLTDEQKKDMKEDEIKLWEGRAKEGLLKGDEDLRGMLEELRGAFFYYDKNMKGAVKGMDINLSDIGITTSSDTRQRGKLVIDDEKLKEALRDKPEEVAKLFTKTSETHKVYNPDNSHADKQTRFKEEGIFQRVNDIIMDYTRTSRNKDGKRGIFIEKAGIKGHFSEKTNLFSNNIKEKEDKIYEMEKKLAQRENRYYFKFAQLEKAMQKANSQAAWFAQQAGGGAQ